MNGDPACGGRACPDVLMIFQDLDTTGNMESKSEREKLHATLLQTMDFQRFWQIHCWPAETIESTYQERFAGELEEIPQLVSLSRTLKEAIAVINYGADAFQFSRPVLGGKWTVQYLGESESTQGTRQ
ncbi:MAG: hypothetical protein R3C18_10180 [Planctomycetaceae bacterium]